MKECSDFNICASQMLTPSPLHASTHSQLKPCNCLAGGTLPSDNQWPVSRQDPQPQPSPSKCVDFYTHFIWESGKESSGPSAAMARPEASGRQPEGWPLFPRKCPSQKTQQRYGIQRKMLTFLVSDVPCYALLLSSVSERLSFPTCIPLFW